MLDLHVRMTRQHPYRKQALVLHALTEPSAESRIRVSEVSTSITLRWPTSRRPQRTDRWLVWFCIGVAPILLAEMFHLRSGGYLKLIPLWWLAAWLWGGAHLLVAAVHFFREPGPEQIILMDGQLRYIPGRVWSWDYVRRLFRHGESELLVPLHELSSLRLQQGGNRQRLILDRNTHWIEVGKILTDPERLWLADAIGTWADSHRYR